MPRTYIEDLASGDRVSAVFGVRDIRRKTTKAGKPYLSLKLVDRSGDIPAVCWELPETLWTALQGDTHFVHAAGTVQPFDGRPQVTLTSVAPADAPADLADLIPSCPGDRDAHWTAFRGMARSLKDPHLVLLMKGLFAERGFRDRFREASAAEKMHHAYAGGLLEHTVEVAEVCLAVCEKVPGLRRDLLLVGALLHDVGKTEEIECTGATFSATLDGGLVGHVTLGASMVDRIIHTIPGFPASLRAGVLHLILAHQGTREWGAPVLPAIPEALVLHACDNMSAKIHEFAAARREAAGGLFTYSSALQGRVFLGEVDLDGLADAPANVSAWLDDAPDGGRPVLRIVPGGLAEPSDLPEFEALPILGRIAAGVPIDAQEHVEGYMALPLGSRAEAADFLLRVSGDSMRDAHILHGDLVRIRPHATARDGDIVAAVRNGEVTVKRIVHRSGALLLHPENPAYEDIPVQASDEFHIQGIVVGLIRESM